MSDPNEEPIEDFDVQQAVYDFRAVIERRDAAITPEVVAECNALADSLRRRWAEWQGEDCLYETAFGGPY